MAGLPFTLLGLNPTIPGSKLSVDWDDESVAALPLDERLYIWDLVKADRDGEILVEVSDAVRESLISTMDTEELVAATEALPADEIAAIADDLPQEVMDDVLQSLPVEEREQLRAAMSFDDDMVGAWMDFDDVQVRSDVTLEVVLRYLRRFDELPSQTDQLFVVDRNEILLGVLPLNRLIVSDPEALQHLRVYTTIDPDLQRVAYEIVNKRLEKLDKYFPKKEKGNLNAALVAIRPKTGEIVAMVGGRDYLENQFNRATDAMRQPGSVFKPFVYTAAVRNGFPVSYVVDDRPLSMPMGNGETWTPENFDRRFRGPVTLRHALTNSINVPTVRLMFDVGIQAVIDYARDAGITSELPPYGSLALGAADLNPMEVLRAYTVYPTYGTRITPIAITRIEDRNGNVIRTYSPARTRILTEQEAYIVTTILEDVVEKGTARYGVRGQGFEWPAAGKTGTTNESTDAWFVGFTPEYITLTWVGFDRKQRIRYNGTGGVLAAPVWTDFMKVAHEGLEIPEEGFPEPPGLEHVRRVGELERNARRTVGAVKARAALED